MASQPTYSHVATRGDNDDQIPFVDGVEVTNRSTVTSSERFMGQSNDIPNQYVGKMIAPSTLPEGYNLPVRLGSSQFNVQIPKGGVEQGQEFDVSIPQGIDSSFKNQTLSTLPPVGVWRDDICDCCKYGMFHPSCLTSTCCHLGMFL
jgi:hypothetical protein